MPGFNQEVYKKLEKNYLVTISGPSGNLTGIIDDSSVSVGLGINLTASKIASAAEDAGKGMASSFLNHLGNKFKSVKGLTDMGKEALSSSLHTLGSTVETFDTAKKVSFSFSFTYIPTLHGGSYSQLLKNCASLTGVKIDARIINSSMVSTGQLAALSTNPKALDGQLASVKIGNWFHTPGNFWVTDATPSFSTVVDTTGQPAFATVSVSLQAYRVFASSEINYV